MADTLGSSLRAQRDFVANASHQLRTPLTGMKLRLEAIRAEGGTAGENAAKAEEELDRLEALVDDLLALAGAATRRPGMNVDLSAVVEDAVERWQAPAAKREDRRAQGAEPALVFADPGDLAHVVDNLIENALRYTPPGANVTVESGVRERAARPSSSPTTGPGFPERTAARVFERFYRGSNGRRLGPGTGLGLAIVAELVERWDGEVRSRRPGTRVEVAFRQDACRSLTGSLPILKTAAATFSHASLTTVLVAIAGLALPVGLALAVYLSSASTIAATPARCPSRPHRGRRTRGRSTTTRSPTTRSTEWRLVRAMTTRAAPRRPAARTPTTSGSDDRSGGGGGGPTTTPAPAARARTRDPAPGPDRVPGRTTRAATTAPPGT